MEKRLLELLSLAFQDQLSENQREELESLLLEFPEYQHMAKELQFSREHLDELKLVKTIQVQKEWQQILTRQKKSRKLRNRKTILLSVGSVAAILLLAIGIWLLLSPSSETGVIPVAQKQKTKKVTLEYSNGKTLTLDINTLTVGDEGQILDTTTVKELANLPSGHVRLNKLFVPKGCDFSLTLADGTQIRLNADTRLEYPSEFSADHRIVYLEGEAFFKVVKDKSRPFIVKTKKLDVEVTGTSFNVMAYPSETSVQTTLVQGGVNVLTDDGKVCKLLPGEQCVVDKTSGEYVVNKVNTDSFTSWLNGEFFFDNESMESLMRKIARWYDVEVEFENEELKSELFYGTVTRSDSITEVLDILVLTKTIHYEIKNRTVHIRK